VNKKSKTSLFEGVSSLGEIGEFGLIDRVAVLFQEDSRENGMGIGDDCAVLPYKKGKSLLITTDMLIENRHFRNEWIPPGDLGYKSLAVNISDISAMGGKPEYAFLSIGLNNEITVDWLDHFFADAHELAEKYNVNLMGGDTTKSPDGLVISYTLLGSMNSKKILFRSGAQPGDKIALIGKVGESGAGLELLIGQGLKVETEFQPLVQSHNRPRLFVEEAQFLAESGGVHSMIDLSDGIQSDARHIANRSGVVLNIDIEKLPISTLLTEFCRVYSSSAVELALTSGEDYGLLFTLDGSMADNITEKFRNHFRYPISLIGEVTEGKPVVNYFDGGKPVQIEKQGFDHFKTT
jgi:thiamine-monophosphate kinase